jgi:pyroglutamyl-peptidase
VPAGETILEGAPDLYETPAPLAALRDRLLAEGAAARISDDAGTYVCNHAYFTALHAIAQRALPTRCLFMHLPPASAAFPLQRQITAVETVLGYLSEGW